MTDRRETSISEIIVNLMKLDETSLELIKFGTVLLKARDKTEGCEKTGMEALDVTAELGYEQSCKLPAQAVQLQR